jgi:hypothetical protein
MIGIMLDIQPNERLGNAKDNCDKYTTFIPIIVIEKRSRGREGVLQKEEECYVDEGPGEVSRRSEFTSSADYLEHLRFDLPFEGSVELVPKKDELEI